MIDLQPFCFIGDPNCVRYDYSAPWVCGHYRYATDGRIIVRVPTGDPDTQPTGKPFARKQDCEAIIKSPEQDALLLLLPPAPPTVMVACTLCTAVGKCPACGQVCPDCKGETRVPDPSQPMLLDCHTYIRARHRRLLDTLPNVRWYQAEPKKTIYFKFDGGDGALMPIAESQL